MGKKIKILINDKETECDLLFTVNDSNNVIKYIACTDNAKDENGNAKIYLGKYEGDRIIPLHSKKDEIFLEQVVSVIRDEVLKNEN